MFVTLERDVEEFGHSYYRNLQCFLHSKMGNTVVGIGRNTSRVGGMG